MSYGFINDRDADPEAYVFGSGQLQGEVLQSDGQWDAFLPTDEYQNLNGIEPLACATFGTFNAIETMLRRLYTQVENYSDRYTAKFTGTDLKKGNSPHVVAETIRRYGAVYEPQWPFTPDIDTFEKYYAALPFSYFALQEEFLDQFEFGHDYVPTDPASIKEALRYSPVCFSVYAWLAEGDLYIKPQGGRDNHWVMCYGYEDGKYWKVFDSYDSSHKKVRWDAVPEMAKRYSIKRTAQSQQQLSGWRQALQAFLDWMAGRSQAPKTEPQPTPAPVPDPSPVPHETPAQQLYNAAFTMQGKDASPRDRASDDVACAESVNEIYKSVFGSYIGNGTLSTAELTRAMRNSNDFRELTVPEVGCITVFPTTDGVVGHCGVWGERWVMSNNSSSGLWEANYTHAAWFAAAKKRRLPVFHFLPQ